MIWWILIIAGIAFGIYYAVDLWMGCFGGVAFSLLCGFMGGVLALLTVLLISCCDIPHLPAQHVDSTEILALRDGTNINGTVHGHIFCTSGYVNEEPVYTVLINTDRGMQTKTYKASKTYIQFTDEAPRVETCVNEATGFWNFFCGDGILDTVEYIIYIPADSEVVSDYVIDLE